jgi:hypothetical protein
MPLGPKDIGEPHAYHPGWEFVRNSGVQLKS